MYRNDCRDTMFNGIVILSNVLTVLYVKFYFYGLFMGFFFLKKTGSAIKIFFFFIYYRVVYDYVK